MTKTPIILKQTLVPFIVVTSLFALWGFANDITNPMVSAFKKVLELSNTEASWVQAAFYGGYFTMSLPAAYVLQRYSFKTGILVGLSLYALGALLFYPAAALQSYLFFLTALYVLTFGLAFLETTANPLILSLGPAETATRRLNLAQSFNPVGALSGLFIAQTFILKALQSDDTDASGQSLYETLPAAAKEAVKTADLNAIRNPYVVLGLVLIVLILIIAKTNIPEKPSSGEAAGGMGGAIRRLLKKVRCAHHLHMRGAKRRWAWLARLDGCLKRSAATADSSPNSSTLAPKSCAGRISTNTPKTWVSTTPRP